jgi:hypothetical protein
VESLQVLPLVLSLILRHGLTNENFSESLDFWTFSRVRYSRNNKTRRAANWNCYRPHAGGGGQDTTQLGPLDRTNLNHWTTPVRFTQRGTQMSVFPPTSENIIVRTL